MYPQFAISFCSQHIEDRSSRKVGLSACYGTTQKRVITMQNTHAEAAADGVECYDFRKSDHETVSGSGGCYDHDTLTEPTSLH